MKHKLNYATNCVTVYGAVRCVCEGEGVGVGVRGVHLGVLSGAANLIKQKSI